MSSRDKFKPYLEKRNEKRNESDTKNTIRLKKYEDIFKQILLNKETVCKLNFNDKTLYLNNNANDIEKIICDSKELNIDLNSDIFKLIIIIIGAMSYNLNKFLII